MRKYQVMLQRSLFHGTPKPIMSQFLNYVYVLLSRRCDTDCGTGLTWQHGVDAVMRRYPGMAKLAIQSSLL